MLTTTLKAIQLKGPYERAYNDPTDLQKAFDIGKDEPLGFDKIMEVEPHYGFHHAIRNLHTVNEKDMFDVKEYLFNLVCVCSHTLYRDMATRFDAPATSNIMFLLEPKIHSGEEISSLEFDKWVEILQQESRRFRKGVETMADKNLAYSVAAETVMHLVDFMRSPNPSAAWSIFCGCGMYSYHNPQERILRESFTIFIKAC